MSGQAIDGGHELKEITGPSALGGGSRRFFDLLWLSAITEFKLGFHGTALGFLWSLLRPLLLFSVLLVVFTHIFRFGDQVKDYPALLLFNIMLFGFFQEATTIAVTSVVRNESVVRKMQFPRLVIPLSVVVTRPCSWRSTWWSSRSSCSPTASQPLWTWLLVPFLIVALVALTTATAMLLSALFVRFRDISIIWTVAATVLFYASPVLYPIEVAPAGIQDVIALNPLSPIFEQAHEWIIDPNAPGFIEAAGGNPLLVVIPAALFMLTLFLGVWVFNREAPRIAEEL